MSLDARGIISAISIAVYFPVIFLGLSAFLKFRRRAWFLLFIFAFIRFLGGVLLVAAETVRPAVIGLYTGGYALEASGLSPLLLCTLELLHITTQDDTQSSKHEMLFRILHLVGIAALVLTIVAISSTSSSSTTELRAGVIIFAVLCIILTLITALQWTRVRHILRYRKKLLAAVSFAVPFLAVRTLYSVLSAFSSSSFFATTSTAVTSGNSLAKFNFLTGEWQIFLGMDVIMEYVIVLIYSYAAVALPLDKDYKDQARDDSPYIPPRR